MSERADRLRERRKKSKEAVQATADERDEQSKQSQTSKPSKTGETDKTTVKDEQVGTYLYLPEAQKQEMGLQYKILSAEYEREFGEELEKNRHFYPLVVQHGLDRLHGLDGSDIRELLEQLDY